MHTQVGCEGAPTTACLPLHPQPATTEGDCIGAPEPIPSHRSLIPIAA